jgi:hypothetical protein
MRIVKRGVCTSVATHHNPGREIADEVMITVKDDPCEEDTQDASQSTQVSEGGRSDSNRGHGRP